MHSPEIQAQIDEHTRRALIDRRPVPPLFLVFEGGSYVRDGRVLASDGEFVVIAGKRCVRLLVPLADALRPVHPDSITGDRQHFLIAQSGDGCVALNGPAMEMAALMRR